MYIHNQVLIEVVEAVLSGDDERARDLLMKLVVEAREMQHHIFADRLEAAIKGPAETP